MTVSALDAPRDPLRLVDITQPPELLRRFIRSLQRLAAECEVLALDDARLQSEKRDGCAVILSVCARGGIRSVVAHSAPIFPDPLAIEQLVRFMRNEATDAAA